LWRPVPVVTREPTNTPINDFLVLRHSLEAIRMTGDKSAKSLGQRSAGQL
jgi:hypothetical protein